MKELVKIQSELKAPKNQRNNFGKYNYRSCEDILEALKPLLLANECTLTLSDSINEVLGYFYVESNATITNKSGDVYICTAQAGIDPSRKGMDIAQSFGSSSSYSRKYALNGLFLIDDTKDADATNTHDKKSAPVKKSLSEKDFTTLREKGNLNQVTKVLTEFDLTDLQKSMLLIIKKQLENK